MKDAQDKSRTFFRNARTVFIPKTGIVEARSQGYIYVWILVGGNSIRWGSSDLTWTIVVRFVNWSAGKRALSFSLSLFLSHTHWLTLFRTLSSVRHESPSKLTMPISIIRQVGALSDWELIGEIYSGNSWLPICVSSRESFL